MSLLSECCAWPPTDDSQTVCARCHQNTSFEEVDDDADTPGRMGNDDPGVAEAPARPTPSPGLVLGRVDDPEGRSLPELTANLTAALDEPVWGGRSMRQLLGGKP